ncbi:TRAP transporter small permease [Cardiobacteriaceae bacterium TAE3-ERU3]|nr:TRAP transporter small permease [Cardiobacteriaceae bacterium TAE3-ERU3]
MVKFIHRFEEAILCLLLTGLTVLVFFETLLRFQGKGTLWMEETVQWTVAWFVLFGASYGVRVGAHIGLTVLTDKIAHPTIKRIIALIAVGVCIAYTIIFLYSSWQYVYTQYRIGFGMNDLPVKQWIPYTGLLIGFALLLIRFSVITWQLLTGKINSLNYADEAKESVEQHAQPMPKTEENIL